jgi:phenylalanyl-tRNA synthetase alpha chain
VPADHPYTVAGRQLDVMRDGTWIEIGECGLADPGVLAAAGLPGHHGLAMGIGLDRALMMRKGIDDIRLLRSTDPRVAIQMRDLEPYRPVSSQPPAWRDLSVAVAADTTAEEIGDCVRAALGDEAAVVEEIAVLAETPADDLPHQAIERLGLQEGQKNVLIRVVLRHPTRTIPDEEANRVRNAIYAAVHEGTEWTWANR